MPGIPAVEFDAHPAAGPEPSVAPDVPAPLTELVWPVRFAVALVLAVAGINLLASRGLRALPASGLDATGISLAILAIFLTAYAIELGIVALFANRANVGFAQSVGLRRVPSLWQWVAIAAAAAFGLRLVATAYAGFLFAMRWRLPGWDANPMKYFPRTTLGTAALVFIVVIAAPIVEETVFRGVLLPSLAGRLGERWARRDHDGGVRGDASQPVLVRSDPARGLDARHALRAIEIALGGDRMPLGVQRARRPRGAGTARKRRRVSGSSQHLTLFEDRCDQCGACKAACPHGAIKVGAAFIYVDWRKCEGCLKCVEACDRKAIVSRVVPLRSSSAKSTVPLVRGQQGRRRFARRGQSRAQSGGAGGQGEAKHQAVQGGSAREDASEEAPIGSRAAPRRARRPKRPPSGPPRSRCASSSAVARLSRGRSSTRSWCLR